LFSVCANSACRALGGNCICLSGFMGVTCTTSGTGCNVVVPDCRDNNTPAAAC
jgi:hypothetical protein